MMFKFLSRGHGLVLAGAVVLASCTTPVSVIQDVQTEDKSRVAFESTVVSIDDELDTQRGLDQPALEAALSKHFAAAAAKRTLTGEPLPVVADVEILAYREPNAGLAILLGDTSQIVGYVRLKDQASDELVGEYYIEVVESAGGLLGLATADINENGLAREFVEKFFREFDKPEDDEAE